MDTRNKDIFKFLFDERLVDLLIEKGYVVVIELKLVDTRERR